MIKAIELFGGIGAATQALKRQFGKENIEIVDYVELDKHAVMSYNAINGTNFVPTDINDIDMGAYPEVDVVIAGWPCQDYSVAGKGLGLEGTRSNLILLTISKIKEMTNRPKHILLENVKGLLSKRHKDDLEYIKELFDELGYNWNQAMLNSKYFGVPQARERVFMLLTRKDLDMKKIDQLEQRNTVDKVLADVLDFEAPTQQITGKFNSNDKVYIKNTMGHYGDKYFEKTGKRIFIELDMDKLENQERGNINKVAKLGYFVDDNFTPISFAQKRYLLNINGVSKTLRGGTENTGGDPHYENGIIFKDVSFNQDKSFHGINGQAPTLTTSGTAFKAKVAYNEDTKIHYRILTPQETWILMGFTKENFNTALEAGVGTTALTKQAGNSIVVNVLEAIFSELFNLELPTNSELYNFGSRKYGKTREMQSKKLIRSLHNAELKYCECAMCEKETLNKAYTKLKYFEKRIEKYPSQITREETAEMHFLLQKVADIEELIIASDIKEGN